MTCVAYNVISFDLDQIRESFAAKVSCLIPAITYFYPFIKFSSCHYWIMIVTDINYCDILQAIYGVCQSGAWWSRQFQNC